MKVAHYRGLGNGVSSLTPRSASAGQRVRRLSRDAWPGVILPGQVVPADVQHLHKHARTVDQRMDARAPAVSPGDRHFLHAEAELPRQEENLRIKSPPFNFLHREDRLDRRL